jgi:uncharacterized delta-60 repeat protein
MAQVWLLSELRMLRKETASRLRRAILELLLSGAVLTTAWAAGPPPVITVQPSDESVPKAGTASFFVSASSSTTLSYQWYFGSSPIGGANSSSYTRSNVTYANAGTYYVAVMNSGGTVNSRTATLTVTNNPPVANNDSYTTPENAPLTVAAPGVLANDTDANGDTLSAFLVSGVSHGTLTLNANGGFSYSPIANYYGLDSFTYQASDGMAQGNVATVTINVTFVDQPPVPNNQTVVVPNFSATNLVLTATDVDSSNLTYAILAAPTNGVLSSLNTNTGAITYTPGPSRYGPDSFTFTAFDGSLYCTGRVSITILSAPQVLAQPQSQNAVVGQSPVFSVVAGGTAPFSYQWLRNGTPLAGATGSALTLTNVQVTNAGNYSVVITNGLGSVPSAAATLAVFTPPGVVTQPQAVTATQGFAASFSVAASGSPPLNYQWQYLGTNIAGATSSTLSLTNVQLIQAGAYQVKVSSPWGSIMSAPALLTVVLPAGTDQPLARGLLVHLAFDGNLLDSSGRGNHGQAVGSPNLVPGFIGSGGLNPFTGAGTQNYVTLGRPGDLSFGTNTDFSIAFWARQPVGSWNSSGSNYWTPAYIANKDWSSGSNPGWALCAEAASASASGDLWWNYTEAAPNTRIDYHSPTGSFGGSALWHHVAVTFQRGGTASTYIDGILINTTSLGTGGTSIDTSLPVNIGTDGTGAYCPCYGYWTNAFGNPFNGLALDDLGIWRRVLTPQEVCAAYNQGLTGGDLTTVNSTKLTLVALPRITQQPASLTVLGGNNATLSVTATGSALAYQWFWNGNPLGGATNSSLLLTGAQFGQSGTYWVVVSNSGGAVTSAVATLTVNAPPFITAPPASQVVGVGTNATGVSVTFLVAASGTAPLSYQWQFNGTNVAGGTNSTLTLSNVQANNQGTYAVAVTNSFGSVTSAATLTVIDPTVHFLAQSAVYSYTGTAARGDSLTAMVLDAQGNVYVTGYANETNSASYDYVTLKYSPTGVRLWRAMYDGGAGKTDQANALAVDAAGNVYVTGASASPSVNGETDVATVKYDPNGNQLWAARYTAIAGRVNNATGVAVDSNGNVFVTGYGVNALGRNQYITLKYNSAGQQVWVQTYVGPGLSGDQANAIGLDPAGNVYVTGQSPGVTSGNDYATLKYSNSGLQLWVARYDGPGSKDDIPAAMLVDLQGNVYVTGSSYNASNNTDYATVKYDSDGNQLWVARYDGPVSGNDSATDLVMDSAGNLFVTGSSAGVNKSDYATVKYSPQGQQLWVQRYDDGSDDQAASLALDPAGNVYVTGKSQGGPGAQYDLATLKYLGSDGSLQGVARYINNATEHNAAIAIAVDNNYNVYLAGQAFNPLAYLLIKYVPTYLAQYPPPVAVNDAATTYKNFPVTIPVLANDSDPGGAPLTIVSTSTTNGIAAISGTNVVFTASSNFVGTVVFTYNIYDGTNYSQAAVTVTVLDTALSFYQPWTANYPGTAVKGAYLTAMVLDAQGNVYVTGYSTETNSGSQDYVTLKYSPTGALLWRAVYNGPVGNGADLATAMAVDSAGNVYVTGSSVGTVAGETDYATVKYDPNGNQMWVARYDGFPGRANTPAGVAVDANGNVFVTGSSVNALNRNQYATIKYNSIGQQVWVNTYVGPGSNGDSANAIAVDPAGNVYVTGQSQGVSSGNDYATIKYANSGLQLWVARYDGPGSKDDIPTAMVVDAAGNAYVTGSSYNSNNTDYATVKYDRNGNQIWVARYNGPAGGNDYAKAIALDSVGNVFVTGASSSGTKSDYATLKYDPSGNQLWVQRYDNGNDDQATDLALDALGNVYVTGNSQSTGAGYDFATVKYLNADGSLQAVTRYMNPGTEHNVAVAVAVDGNYNVYVGGQAFNPMAYVLLKYQPSYLMPTVWSLPASGITATSAVLNAVVNPQGAATTCYFQYGPSATYGSSAAVPSLPPGTNAVAVAAALTGLAPATLYHYSLVASNAAGITVGPDATFTTAFPPATVATLPAFNVTAGSAVLPALVNPQGAPTACYFQYGTTTTYGLFSGTNALAGGTTFKAVASPVAGLAPGTLYHYCVVAVSSGGTVLGPDATFTTLSPPPVRAMGATGTDGTMQLSFASLPGARFTVLSSTAVELPLSDWQALGQATETAAGQYQFTDPRPATLPRCFYRIRSP